MELSKRLETVASLVTKGAFVADIGTDHGFVPIWLVQQGVTEHVIAMDINKGPIERARLHIASYGLSSNIETRLSDGMSALGSHEADTVIIAGMGGPLMQRILTQHKKLTDEIRDFILQPQSEIPEFRKFLISNGFIIKDEKCICEDNKYYFILKVCHGESTEYNKTELAFGRHLLENKDSELKHYLMHEIIIKENIISRLESVNSENTMRRIPELNEELELAKDALETYYTSKTDERR